jgi:hypothetical protein
MLVGVNVGVGVRVGIRVGVGVGKEVGAGIESNVGVGVWLMASFFNRNGPILSRRNTGRLFGREIWECFMIWLTLFPA